MMHEILKQFVLLAVLMSLMPAGEAKAQPLTPADVQTALALSAAKKPHDYIASDGAGLFTVYVIGKLGRVALAADRAKRAYTPFPVDAIPPELLSDEVRVEVIPDTPVVNRLAGGMVVAPPFSAVVLKAADGTVVQPLTSTRTPHSWGNALGGQFSAEGAVLTFPPLPAGEFTVVIVADQEYTATFKGKTRQKIQ